MTKVAEMRLRSTANWWAGLVITRGLPLVDRKSLTRADTAVDSMRESMQVLCCEFLCFQDTPSERARSW